MSTTLSREQSHFPPEARTMTPTISKHCRQFPIRLFALPIVLLAFLRAAPPLPAQEKSLPPEKRARLEDAVSHFMASSSVPGVSVAVVLDGAPVWSSGFGMADLENSVPATSQTLYRLASISKSLTAVGALQLFERGKLDLDAEVQKYCPAFPKKDWPITTRELLGHLSGIRHYNPGGKGDIPEDSAKHFASMEESLQVFAGDPLLSKPGTEFHYSTYGFTVVGCVMEKASGQKFFDYLHENVLVPAGMAHTQVDDSFAVVPHRSRWYHKDKTGAVQNAGVLDSSYKIPGGGLISSADDLASFEAAVLAGRLLRPATLDLMWTAQKTADGKSTDYGLGWGVAEVSGVQIRTHTGAQQGTSTAFILAPERRAGVVVLTNMDGLNAGNLADEILKIILDLPDKKTE
jgi:CubicO group peptidase (beta-lactamase class C family)